MATFHVSLSDEDMAIQIANLINNANKLTKIHNKFTILNSHADYFVEICENKVVGCVGLTKMDREHSIVHHASVLPMYRKRGVGKKLLHLALTHCNTPMIYGRIREDNIASLKMSFSVGFKFIEKERKRNYNLILVGRIGGHL